MLRCRPVTAAFDKILKTGEGRITRRRWLRGAAGFFASVAIPSTPAIGPCTNLQSPSLEDTRITLAAENAMVPLEPAANDQGTAGVPLHHRFAAGKCDLGTWVSGPQIWFKHRSWPCTRATRLCHAAVGYEIRL
jgi:hypothetical protein